MAAESALKREQAGLPRNEGVLVEERELFGVRFSNLDFDDLCRWLDARTACRTPGFVVTPNVDHVCRLKKDAEFREAYARAALRLPDGVPLMWCARLLGSPLREKLSGSDLVPRVSAYAAEKGYRVFFLGAADGVAEEAAAKLREKHPALQVAGWFSPPFGFERDALQCREIVERVRESGADLCFVAFGSPKQEIWLSQHAEATEVPVCIGIGAALDFVSGHVRRAPTWVQRIGCEWVWRIAQEPRRLWRRYILEDSYFVILFLREIVRRGRGREKRREP